MLTLKQFQEKVKETVKGQDKAVDVVCTSIYKYILKFFGDDFGLTFNSSSMLLRGPTGVGKTFLIKEALKVLHELPFIEINAKSLGQGGSWKGSSFTNIIEEKLEDLDDEFRSNANKKVVFAVIFIDEFDKMLVPNICSGGDDVNEAIQASILKYVEGFNANLKGREFRFDKCLFIFSGAFVGLEKLIEQKSTIGFQKPLEKKDSNSLRKHYIDFGLLPELAGRIQEYVELRPIQKEVFEELLNTPTFINSTWKQLLEKMDVSITYNHENIINQAIEFDLGVRGLIQAVEESVTKSINDNIDLIDLERFSILSPHRTNQSSEDV